MNFSSTVTKAEEGQGDEEDATEQAGDYYAALAQSFGQHSMHSRTKLPFIAMATEKSAQIFPDRL